MLRSRTLLNGVTYQYIIDNAGIVHVVDRELPQNSKKYGDEYANTDRKKSHNAVEKLWTRQGDNGSNSGIGRHGRKLRETNTDDLQQIHGSRSSNGTGNTANEPVSRVGGVAEKADDNLIKNPIITSVLEISEYNETTLSEIRNNIYEIERKGIPTASGRIFVRYYPFNFPNYSAFKRNGAQNAGHNNRLGAYRGGSGGATQGALSGSGKYPLNPVVKTFTDLQGKRRIVFRYNND